MDERARKLFASLLLMFIPGLMFLKFELFTLISLIFLIVSVVLAIICAKWGIKEPGVSILDFVRLFISRYFVGELTTSIYGLLLFVIFAVVLTAWLPDSIENGEPVWTLGLIFYLIGTIMITAWVYPPPKKKPTSDRPEPADYLVYALSKPSNWKEVGGIECDKLKMNPRPINILPLYVSMYYHLNPPEDFGAGRRLKGIYLLITDEHVAGKDSPVKEEVRLKLRAFLEKASDCLGVRFNVHWPCEGVETIGKGENEVFIKFVYVGDGNRVKEVYSSIASSEIGERIDRSLKGEGEVSFHITGGTAAISSAMMLHAIRGSLHAEYAKQGVFNVPPEELLQRVDLDIFDLDLLIRELREYFEREYEKELRRD